ncbi:tyrosine protein phosphatase [Streptococcus sp. X16XC17]|uniref:capsular polysaccharide biosynthesis protein Cps4B n=1 Tax=unclassified Streptococcus TaxID=2608887 RepID=UPI00066FDEF4|nr:MULTISPECIES: capsular polysaccharide biosynthesis protein Cps4B [unclassified Streptococcus]TCD46257.1 tyrosine protein phosphatase [Streptococcus sp. X16XC17]
MIDIHSHVIFGVDDGPDTIEESLSLIGESYRQGVRTIVATSHRRKGMFETPEDVIARNFSAVQEKVVVEFPDMTLCYGGELYFTTDILEKLASNQFPRMHGTKFALIEFSMGTRFEDMQQALQALAMIGVTPIIAHIERYMALEFNKERVQSLIDMGCYTQINSSHVLKPKLFGDSHKVFKKRAAYFLKENMVHCVASDMHNLTSRPPFMEQAYKLIKKDYGSKRAEDLFKTNPATLLADKYV